MSLGIVIVTYNSAEEIGACLSSLTTDPRAAHEIVVVDNNSRDGTPDIVRRDWPAVRLIAGSSNLGFAAATNIGIRRTTSDLILLLNPDTVVPAGAIHSLASRLLAQSDVAVVGPRLRDAYGRPELSFGAMIAPWAELRQKVLVRGHERGWWPVSWYVNRITSRSQFVDWVSGACLLVRRSDAEAAGLFDERYFMYAEDVDFCAMIRSRGRRVLFVADVEVQHLRGRSVLAARATTATAYRRSHLAFYAKHHPALVRLLRLYLKLTGSLPDAAIDARDGSH